MDKPEQQFPVGTYVRLKDGIDPSLYNGFSRTGNTGWIRKRKFDKYKYPQVYIEFNKDHWSWNGTEDGWTWQSHFEVAEESKMDELTPQNNQKELEDKVRGITETFVESLFGALGAPVKQADAPPVSEPNVEESRDDPDKWENLAVQAANAVIDAPAYLVITLEHIEVPGAPQMVIPRVFHAAREPEQALIVQSQLAHVLANLQDTTIAAVLQQETNGNT
jgi:hypothetical protein